MSDAPDDRSTKNATPLHVRMSPTLKGDICKLADEFGQSPSGFLRWLGQLAVDGRLNLPRPGAGSSV